MDDDTKTSATPADTRKVTLLFSSLCVQVDIHESDAHLFSAFINRYTGHVDVTAQQAQQRHGHSLARGLLADFDAWVKADPARVRERELARERAQASGAILE